MKRRVGGLESSLDLETIDEVNLLFVHYLCANSLFKKFILFTSIFMGDNSGNILRKLVHAL